MWMGWKRYRRKLTKGEKYVSIADRLRVTHEGVHHRGCSVHALPFSFVIVLRKEDWAMVFINGEQREGYVGKPLPDVLAGEKYDVKRIAVEINGEIISKSLFEETTVEDGDRIEVVSFVGGG